MKSRPIAERDQDTNAKWLTELLPIMEIQLESLYQCQGDYFERDGVNRNFGRWWSYGRRNSGRFG